MDLILDKYFTEREEKHLLNTIKNTDDIMAKRDYYWMLLMRETGIRLGVLAGVDSKKAKLKNMDTTGLTVGEAESALTGEYLQYRGDTNKRDKQHPVSLNKSAKHALSALLIIHKKMSAGWDWSIDRADRPLILSRNRQAMTRRSYQERLQKWCKKAGVSVGSPHWWRHTWAVRYLDRSTSPDALRRIQAVLGHQNINTTAIYTRPNKEQITTAMLEASTCRK